MGIGAIELVPGDHFMIIKQSILSLQKQNILCQLINKKIFGVLRMAKSTLAALGCKGVARTDFKFYKNKFIY